jgi:hypothetical protein
MLAYCPHLDGFEGKRFPSKANPESGFTALNFSGLQEVVWVFLATSERWEHACEHLEPQIFLVA